MMSQTFAPVGATWHYNYTEQGDTGFVKIESTHDTTILGKPCQAVQLKESCKFHGENRISQTGDYEVYLHTSADSVFLYHEYIDSFQLLYAFNAQVNDSWSFVLGRTNMTVVDTVKVEVNSIFTETINSQPIRSLEVSYTFFPYNSIFVPYITTSKISEVIGDFDFLFNFYGVPSLVICDDLYPSKLRCYSDNSFGNYETGIVDSCTYYGTYVGVNELGVTDVNVWPNPVMNTLHVQNNFNEGTDIYVYDITGNLILTKKFGAGKIEFNLDLAHLSKGIYFIQVKSKTTTISKRIVKQ